MLARLRQHQAVYSGLQERADIRSLFLKDRQQILFKAYIKVKTENIGYGELTKTDESSGVKLSGAVYGIYSDSGCTNRVQTMTTDGNGYAKSAALVAGTYYVKEIYSTKGYVLSGKVHTLTVRAGQTTGISATDKEQFGAITIIQGR